jgi:hypothetical protein
MTHPTPIEQQAETAMKRITQQINRSAGQHQRAVRKVRAGQPVSEGTTSAQHILRTVPLASLHRVDTQQLPPEHTALHHGEPTEAEMIEAHETESGMQMLAYLLIALVATAGAIGLGVLFSSI